MSVPWASGWLKCESDVRYRVINLRGYAISCWPTTTSAELQGSFSVLRALETMGCNRSLTI